MKQTVIQFLSSMNDGGAETLVKDYALMLDSEDVEVKIVTIYPPSNQSANYLQLKSKQKEICPIYKRFPLTNIWILQKFWNRFIYKYYVCHKLASIVERDEVACIHVHNDVLQYLKPISNRLLKKRILYTCHSVPSRYFNDTDRRKEKRAAEFLFKHNDFHIIALHDEMRRAINKMFNVDSTFIVRNGVDFERFRCVRESVAEIRHSLGIPLESFVVGHVGRFSFMKNHFFLVDIFAEISRRKTGAFLLLVGDGPEREKVEAKLKEMGLLSNVIFLSGRSDIPQLLHAMDVFVFPSIFEGLPVSIVESQVAGVRTLASDVITSECFFSGNLIPMSLREPASKWAEVALDSSLCGPYKNDINEFDMKNVLHKLKSLYLDENCSVYK